jgi:ADP-ribose pyrophosphatase
MSSDGVWIRHARIQAWASSRLQVVRDLVSGPGGERGSYDWVATADQVRVAAFVDDHLLLIDQHHYLIGRSWQLPGGAAGEQETAREAAERELREETGLHGGAWSSIGMVHALPSLTPARVHLWSARDLTVGPAEPDSGEADLRVVHIPLREAADAVLSGKITCAASATLILLLSIDT